MIILMFATSAHMLVILATCNALTFRQVAAWPFENWYSFKGPLVIFYSLRVLSTMKGHETFILQPYKFGELENQENSSHHKVNFLQIISWSDFLFAL